MSFIQCSECEATVEATKAYCPDCGAAMDEEAKRTSVSEFDSLMKTQNISKTTQFRLVEQFKLSTVFKPPTQSEIEASEKQKANPPHVKKPAEDGLTQMLPPDGAEQSNKIFNPTVDKQDAGGEVSKSNKNLYIIVAAVSIFFILVLITVIVLGFLVWKNSN